MGGVTGAIGAGAGAWAAKSIGTVTINSLNISGAAIKGLVGGAIGGGLGGFASGVTGAALSGAGWEQALSAGLQGAAVGAAIGAIVGTARGIKHARLNNENPWTGDVKIRKAIGAANRGFSKKTINFGKVKVNSETFHREIKPNILDNAGDFSRVVGKNPDIKLNNGTIDLTGARSGPFRGKTFKTGLKIEDFFKLR